MVVAYVWGSREEEMLWLLWTMLSELNIDVIEVYSDNNFAYHNVISPNVLIIGKKNTQKIGV